MAFEETIEDTDESSELSEYSPKSEFSKASVVEEAIRTAFNSRAKEMKPGYHNFKVDKFGNAIKIWIPDARKIFIGAVTGMIGLLAPEISKSDRMNEIMEEFETIKETIKQKYIYKERRRIRLENGNGAWKLTGREYLPEIDEELPIEDKQHPLSSKWDTAIGIWNKQVNAYWDEMVELFDDMFGELNVLVDELNYFKSKASF